MKKGSRKQNKNGEVSREMPGVKRRVKIGSKGDESGKSGIGKKGREKVETLE